MLTTMQLIDHRGFEPGKRKIKAVVMNCRARERIGIGIARMGKAIHLCTARIRDAHHAGNLIKSLTDGIIPCAADGFKPGIIAHINQRGVPAGSDQRQKRGLWRLGQKIRGGNMPFDMIHLAKGKRICKGIAFCKIHTDQQRPDQPRMACYTDAVRLHACRLQCLCAQCGNSLRMSAGGNFGHNPAIAGMQRNLRIDFI